MAQRKAPGRPQSAGKPDWADVIAKCFDRIYSPDPLRFRFIAFSLLTTALAVTLFFFTYLRLQPALYEDFIANPMQRSRVLEQVLGIALLVNAVADYLCLAYFREVLFQLTDDKRTVPASVCIAQDLGLKVVIFTSAISLVYVLFALNRGSFAGDPWLALKAVPETLAGGLFFRNLSCVYIYSALVSSMWLWSFLGARALAGMPGIGQLVIRTFPVDQRPIRSLGILAALLAMLAYWLLCALSQR